MSREFKVFSGHANLHLAEEICRCLKVHLGKAVTTTFSDGELYFQILENVRGRDVFVIQPTCPPVNNNLMELLIMIDAFKRASAARITAVIPYYGYGAGIVRLSLGDNQELAGAVKGSFVRWFFFPDATVEVNGRAIVKNGKLLAPY